MRGSFEKKSRGVETEAKSYEVEASFSPRELIQKIQQVKRKAEREKEEYNKIERFEICYALSKSSLQIKLSFDRHVLPPGAEWSTAEGGTLTINTQLQIEDISNHSGSLIRTPEKDFPLVKKLVQKYLNKIKETAS